MVRHVKPGTAEELVEPVAGEYNKNIIFNQNSSIRMVVVLLISTEWI